MTLADDLKLLREKPFVDALAKLEKLLNQSGRVFLMGAGCSKSAGLPLTAELTALVLSSKALDDTSKAILSAIVDLFVGSNGANIEDYLSEVIDLLAIASRRKARGAKQNQVMLQEIPYSTEQLRTAADKIKVGIAEVIDCDVETEDRIGTHRRFVRAVHRPLRPGKAISSPPVDYLVLNYDTLLETALALERIPFSDGLDGGVTAWWNPATFDREGLAARVLKLHGSVNWYAFSDESLPRRIAPKLRLEPAVSRRVLIWPASTKYSEAQLDPYAQLAERARQILRPEVGLPRVLVACGYSFGDSHINIEIDRALRESEGNLTLMVFTSDDEPLGQVGKWVEDQFVSEQVIVFAKRGYFHAGSANRAEEDLPWWKFENVTRLLGGER